MCNSKSMSGTEIVSDTKQIAFFVFQTVTSLTACSFLCADEVMSTPHMCNNLVH